MTPWSWKLGLAAWWGALAIWGWIRIAGVPGPCGGQRDQDGWCGTPLASAKVIVVPIERSDGNAFRRVTPNGPGEPSRGPQEAARGVVETGLPVASTWECGAVQRLSRSLAGTMRITLAVESGDRPLKIEWEALGARPEFWQAKRPLELCASLPAAGRNSDSPVTIRDSDAVQLLVPDPRNAGIVRAVAGEEWLEVLVTGVELRRGGLRLEVASQRESIVAEAPQTGLCVLISAALTRRLEQSPGVGEVWAFQGDWRRQKNGVDCLYPRFSPQISGPRSNPPSSVAE